MESRLALPDDFDFIYAVYMDRDSNPYLTYDPMERAAFENIYASLLTTNTLFVAEENGRSIGTYRLLPKENRQAHCVYLGSFVVDAALKGKGYGFLILDEIKQKCRVNELARIELTVDVNNDRAIRLYKKAGFEIEGRIRKSYKLAATGQYYDEYLMSVLL